MRELTSMQAACWIGRTAHAALGRVSAHLYAEFDGQAIDLDRLRQSLQQACERHPMLRLRVSAEGLQHTVSMQGAPQLEVEDLSAWEAQAVTQHLLRKRERWTHQQLDLRHGPAARVGITLLAAQRFRLHIDTDMIAIDPSSFRVLLEDLAAGYETPDQPAAAVPSFYDWLDAAKADRTVKGVRDRDRHWWRERLEQIAPAPTLPFRDDQPSQARSQRLHTWLAPRQRQALQRLARERRLTLSSVLLGLFAAVLGEQTGDQRFRLNVPSFWRAPWVPDVDRVVGDFANVLILDVDMTTATTPALLCDQLAREMVGLLEHSSYSGVDVMRDLSRHRRATELAPVVFTSALDLPEKELLSARVRRVFGEMNWVISQGPQVALDVQVACADGGILINWDVRLDALPIGWVSELFEGFVARVTEVAEHPAAFDQPLEAPPARQPLNALQQAYLLGRSAHMPLGGVAMQEFREYQGRIDIALLRQRLAAMVQRHPSLRTHIDAHHRVQYISHRAQVNLDVVDLCHLPLADARRDVDGRREAYAHQLFELDRAPWNVTVFNLAPEQQVVFVRMDALILDGRSIAALLLELFTGVVDVNPAAGHDAPAAADPAGLREADATYWRAKLATVTGPPRLPWKRPLEQLGASTYRRQSLQVPKAEFATLCKLGAQHRLFKNSALMALILEVLAHWLDEGDLCVAVPVAPPSSAEFANRSSFIAVNWQATAQDFPSRAATLQADVLEGLQHLAFSGVDLARLLFENHGPGPVLPVVITNGLSWPVVPATSSVQLHDGLTQTPQVAMDIRFSTDPQGSLLLDIDYAQEAVDAERVSAILQALGKAIRLIAQRGELAVTPAALLDTGHYRFNSPVSNACSDRFLARIASNIFAGGNDTVALICGQRHLTYGQLGEGVARMMAALEARGLVPGQVVAICLPRSPEHTMLTLACALTGLIWVPIDASAPEQRRQYLLDNCRPDLVVMAQPEAIGHPTTTCATLLAAPARRPQPLTDLSLSDAPAYYLYTSGTTGQPKCVVLSNRATANVIGSTLAHWDVSARDVLISVTPLHHDMSVFDVFGSLAAGATLVLPEPGEDKDALRWNQLIAQHRVTLWCSVPAIVEMLLACRGSHTLSSLRLVAQGGDYIKPVVINELRELLPQARLISLGGPTETTIWSIWHDIVAQDRTLIPYGRPLPGNRYLVLDAQGQHCPTGVVGRIHTAGVNLALGYLHEGALLQSDFITVDDEQGEPVRAFRSGDRGRYRDDGTLLFDSRVNGYVKIRGVRVSLPDIEKVLSNHPALRQVLVVDYGDPLQGETNLGALFVSSTDGDEVSVAELRTYARQHLQASHVPTRLLAVPQLPLSQNGKVDRQRARSLLGVPTREPATPAGTVLQIYLDVLGRSPRAEATAEDQAVSFISLGLRPQHLKAISAKLEAQFAVALSPAKLLPCRNARDVEQLLANASPAVAQ
ncbi:amino acid adenylation domain-containing protein [Pseudomonas sp. UBA4194]|uniref:amino acid adenylation domain-containing protein n=1 Tax=Pseudomonas sp. UBA4194 TaxID=1947317 RepID=UPI0025CEA820|nr:amino acid adenylation domain-containing protein [Pseudomonas sp. UBA4194]